jgi:hypothetical protein
LGSIPVCAIGRSPPSYYRRCVPTLTAEPATALNEKVKMESLSTGDRVMRVVTLTLLFSGSVVMCLHGSCADDADIWWHLRSGEWILRHNAVPYVDPFSGPLAGHPWLAYSWLFEIIVVKLFWWRGLIGIATYTAAMVLANTIAIYHMVRRQQTDFTLAALLTFFAMFSMGHLLTPRPWQFTILFFVLELDILMHARRTGRLRELAWLPLIFALWANVHIQFIDGLLVLGLALMESVLARWWSAARTRVAPEWLGAAFVGSLLATLANPYGWHVYSVARDLATQSGALNNISELQAIPFRSPADFLVLALMLSSVAVLAWQRRLVFFEWGLLVFATVLSFRSQRDIWVVATSAAAILACLIPARRPATSRDPRFSIGFAAMTAALVIAGAFRVLQVNNERLQSQIAQDLPVRAVEIARQRGYSGPLYNDFSWGGYMIWNLRLPVSIDGRQNLYGDERMDRSTSTWSAEPDWASDPELAAAGLVIGPEGAPLTQALRMDSRFQLAYEDRVAAVFVRRR